MDILNVPVTSMSDLKKSPKKIIEKAKSQKNGVYIFSREKPTAVITSVDDYENMVNKINTLEDELLDYQIEETALERIKKHNKKQKGYSLEEVFSNELNDVTIDEDDGWE